MLDEWHTVFVILRFAELVLHLQSAKLRDRHFFESKELRLLRSSNLGEDLKEFVFSDSLYKKLEAFTQTLAYCVLTLVLRFRLNT